MPLKQTGRTIGLIALGNREGGYTDRERELIEGLAPTIVQAFERARAEEALRRSEEESRFWLTSSSAPTSPSVSVRPMVASSRSTRPSPISPGYSRAELEERALTWSADLTPSEWRDKEARLLAGAVRQRRLCATRRSTCARTAVACPSSCSCSRSSTTRATCLHYRSFLSEISERKRAGGGARGKARPSFTLPSPSASLPSMQPSSAGGTMTL